MYKFDITLFHKAIFQENIFWRKHVLQRMTERNIQQKEVIETLILGNIIREYVDDRPFPSALFLHFINGKPLHVVASFDEVDNMIYIITVYEPSRDVFDEDFKTKKI